MRVISGKARGKKLKSPETDHIRPTLDRVKENIYNMIGFSVRNAVVLDLFSGTGGMGIEALSRGAEKVYFVDNNKNSIELTRYNIKVAGLEKNSEIMHMDAENALIQLEKQNVKLDLIYVDPPYNKGIAQKMLQQILKYNIMQEGTSVILETDKEEETPERVEKLVKEREKIYSSTKITFYGVDYE